VAGLVVWRGTPRRIALCAGAFLVAFPLMFTDIASTVLPSKPLVDAAVQVLGLTSFFLFAYVFPDGRFAPHWIRWLWVTWVLWFVADRLVLPMSGVQIGGTGTVAESIGWIASTFSVVAVQVRRYRGTSGDLDRERTRWVVYGLAVAVVGSTGVVLLADLGVLGSTETAERVVTVVSYAAVTAIPLCLAAAVLRYRLWDIDLLINRTLVYLLLSAVALVIYVGGVLATSVLVEGVGWLPLSAVTVGLLALALQPLHVQVQTLINRLMYGRRDDPYTVLTGLGQRLQSVASAEAVLPAITESAAAALHLPYAAIELIDADGTAHVTAARGTPGPVSARWPLEHQREILGHLVATPRRGDSFSAADTRLLAHLASRAGAAVHAVLLSRALHRAGTELVIAREEERRRLHRDLHDELGATLGALTIKAGAARAMLPAHPDTAAETAREIENGLKEAITEVRRLVYALRPADLDGRGLRGALEDHLARPGAGPAVDVVVRPDDRWPAIPAAVEVAAYRIAQEALTNVRRHAHATHCRLDLRLLDDGAGPSAVQIAVTDDGIGLPPETRPGVGLHSMRDRARELGGSCTVEDAAGGGVRVVAVLPVGSGERP
jgi:signal transduction histidine kinase